MTSIHSCGYKDCYVVGPIGFILEHEEVHKELDEWFKQRINREKDW